MNRSQRWFLLFVGLSWGMLGALGPAVSAAGGAALPVVTSTTVLADLVEQVGGDRVKVTALAPAGTDPHTFQPTPESMRTLSQARVVFFNGSGLEEWWTKAVKAIAEKDTPVVELSKGLAALKHPGDSHGHGGGLDPHVWLDPTKVKLYVERIRDTLAKADSGNAAAYGDRASAYLTQLDELDRWIQAEVEQVPRERRKIVTFHNAFQYFAARYGFAVKGYIVASPGKEPSAKRMADLVKRIKQEGIPAVFAEADFNPKMLETLAREAGVKVVTNLYDGSLTSGPPAETYLAMMRHNVTQMVGALK
jgi:ABC-type Zn uptake system ZnuABC Zn-binding protein ZnuA